MLRSLFHPAPALVGLTLGTFVSMAWSHEHPAEVMTIAAHSAAIHDVVILSETRYDSLAACEAAKPAAAQRHAVAGLDVTATCHHG